jgi:hypothetical protein
MQFLQRATTYVLVFDIKIPPFVYFLNIIRVILSTNKVVKYILIQLFRIMSIPTTFRLIRVLTSMFVYFE